MSSYNKVILMGNLTRDPQMSYTPSNTSVVEIGLATNRKWKDQAGQQHEEVCFVECQMYGKRAENLNKYLHKGDPVLVEGRLKFDSWEAKDGTKRSKLRVMIESFTFVGGQQSNKEAGLVKASGLDAVVEQENAFPPIDDDIPF